MRLDPFLLAFVGSCCILPVLYWLADADKMYSLGIEIWY